MQRLALVLVVAVAGCGGGATTVSPSSTPPGGNSGMPPGTAGGGDMGGTAGGGGSGMPGGGGMPGGDGGDMGGGGSGGVGGGTGACNDTQPVAVTNAGNEAFAVAVDDSAVYFTAVRPNDGGTASVWRAPLSGGAAVEVAHPDEYVMPVTVNDTALFASDDVGHIWRWAKAGGAAIQLRAADGRTTNDCLADAFGYIYTCAHDDSGDVVQVSRAPEDGGGSWTVVASAAGLRKIAFDPQHLWYDDPHGVFAIATDGAAGSTVSIPWNGSSWLGALAVDDSHVFVGIADGLILVADKRDGASLTEFAQPNSLAGQLLVDDGNLYVVVDPPDVRARHAWIMRYAIDGSSTTTLVSMPGTIGRMAIRDQYLYFAHVDDSTVYRVCK